MSGITDQIHELLERTESERNVTILYACESGSRAWGFASPNSDFDIRFLYLAPAEAYFSVFEQPDTIELPIIEELDPGGWDIKKALGLLAKSNGALIEWLHSPIIYTDQGGFRARWQALSRETLNPNHLINHYHGLASQVRKKKLLTEAPTAKGYLYACRALLAAQWVQEYRTPPPVAFADLLELASPDLGALLRETVDWKATADEVASAGRLPELDAYIAQQLDPSVPRPTLPAPSADHVRSVIDAEFKSLISL